MLSANIFSTIWKSDKKFDPESEHDKNGSMKRHWLQLQSDYRKLWQAGFVLLSLVVLRYVYRGAFSPCKFKNSSSQDQAPILHFSTPTSTLNSPNGLFIDSNNTWHIYFQCIPAPDQNMDRASWGHAISSNLYTWSMQPVALQDDEYDILGCSAVIDQNNTSGLFPNQTNGVVAMYTRHHPVTGTQEQAIAYSTDGRYTFTKYSKNPALRCPEENQYFRDPKVIWHESTQHWFATVAKATFTTVGIFTSSNLIDWVAASDFKNQDLVDVGYGFEYPNLVPIPRINSTGAKNPNLPTVPGGTIQDFGDYILLSSSSSGSPLNGGSITHYFPGKFNGTHFESTNNRTDRFIDFGPDNYASQFFFGLPQGVPVVSLGMASNLRYTSSSPADHGLGQTSTFTGPREGYLIHGPGEGDLSYFSRPVGLVSFEVKYWPISLQKNYQITVSFTMAQEQYLSRRSLRCSQAISESSIDNSLMNQMSARQVQPLLPFYNPAVRR